MRRIVTWSTRAWHPWVVIAVWVVAAGALAMGPSLQSVTTNDASKTLPASLESKRAEALQQASFPDAKGTPIIVVFSSDAAAHAPPQKQAIEDGKAWLESGAEPINSARVEYAPDGKGALIFASLGGNARRGGLPRVREAHRRALRRHRRRHGDARHRPRRTHHRRLPDLPQRRRQAPDRHGHPRARPAPRHLPLARPALRAAAGRGLRLLRRRRHPGARRQGHRTRPCRGRPRRSW